jgi:hypothetical protein
VPAVIAPRRSPVELLHAALRHPGLAEALA